MTVDRLASAIESIIDALKPTLLYYATYEYRVLVARPPLLPPAPMLSSVQVSIDCVAIDPPVLASFPRSLSSLTVWPGPSGITAIPAVGSLVRVSFLNGDPARPFVSGVGPGTLQTASALLSFATALSTSATPPQAAAAGLLLVNELTK